MPETPSESTLGIKSSTSGAAVGTDNVDTSLTLDQFQARYTSEDNASFNEIVEKINARKKEKYSWIYDQENKSQKLIEGGRNPDQLLLRQAGEDDDKAIVAREEDASKMSLVMAEKKSGIIPTWDYKVSCDMCILCSLVVECRDVVANWNCCVGQEYPHVLSGGLGHSAR